MKNLNFITTLFIILLACMLIPAVPPGLSAEEQKDTPPTVIEKKPEISRTTPKELRNRLFMGEDVMIVDVRSLEEYNTQHIVTAHSIPLNEIEARIKEFPLDRDIIFY